MVVDHDFYAVWTPEERTTGRLWLGEHRQRALDVAALLPDLFKVCPDIPLASMSLHRIAVLGVPIDDVMRYLAPGSRGRMVRIFQPNECNSIDGQLVVWHEAALQEHLHRDRDLLEWHGWPTRASAFINAYAAVFAYDDDLALMILDARGDERAKAPETFPKLESTRLREESPEQPPRWSGWSRYAAVAA